MEDITVFLSTGDYPKAYSATQKFYMVVRVANYQLIVVKLYKFSLENILRRCILDHERQDILLECHSGVAGGHVIENATSQKFLQARLWWDTLFKYAKECAIYYDVFQRVGKPSRQDKCPLHLV
jgi:hypothetical protein